MRKIGFMMQSSGHPVSSETVTLSAAPALQPRRVPRRLAAALLLVALGGAGYGLFPDVQRMVTGQATLVIETDERAVEVTLQHPDGRSERMEVAGQDRREVPLVPGEYRVRLREKNGGAFADKTVHLGRNGSEVLTVADLVSCPDQPVGSPFRFQGDSYEATVEASGALTSLRVAGVEMLARGAFIAVAPSLWEQGSLPLADVRRQGPAVITARGERVVVRYELGPDMVSLDLRNTSDHPLSYSLIFREEVAVVRGRAGRWARTPADKPWPDTTWFAGPARLEIRGGSRIWGLLKGQQVWEAQLAPKESRRVVLTVGTPAADEAARAAAILAHPPAETVGRPGGLGLVSEPMALPGVRRWALETRGPRGWVTAVAYRPDGRVLAASSDEGAVRLWHVAGGRLLRILLGHTSIVRALAWSPDGSILATGGWDGTVRLWQASSGRPLHILKVPGGKEVNAIAWCPRGKVLASAGEDGLVRLWDTTSGRPLDIPPCRHDIPVWSLAWSPDGATLATGGWDGKVHLWSADSGRPGRSWKASSQLIKSLAWSPDGQTLAAAGAGVSLWEASSARFLRRVEGTNTTAWSPDGQTLATISDGEVVLWEAGTGQPRRSVGRHRGRAITMGWSPEGKNLAIVSWDGAIGIWKAESGAPVRVLAREKNPMYRATWSPDGKTLACGLLRPAQVQLWELEAGRLAGSLPGLWWATWSGDGKRLAAGTEQEVSVWEAGPLRQQGHLRPTPVFREVSWSPDGRAFATRSLNGLVQLWDASSYQLRKTHPQPAALRSPAPSREGRYVAWSPDGRLLASLHLKNVVCIDDAESGRRLAILQDSEGARWDSSLAWSPDSTLLAVGTPFGQANLWDPLLGEMLDSFGGHRGQVAVAWAADGTTLLTAGTDDATVRRWDVRDGRLLSVVRGPGSFLSAFSPDTRRLVGPWVDGFRVWETRTGRVLATLVMLPGNEMVIVGAGGHYAGRAGVERHLAYVVETDAGQEVLSPEEFTARFGWKNDPRQAAAPTRE